MDINTETKVGVIATKFPLATRVFARHNIDFCCGGAQPISVACATRGLDTAKILNEIQEELEGREAGIQWDMQPLGVLVDHILSTYHAPLSEELPRLEAMMRKVHKVHGDKDQPRFDALLRTVLAIRADIEQHLPKEEQILFPMIKSGRGGMAAGPMHVMEVEHEHLGGFLRTARELTNNYVVPAGACGTWRALWAALEDLERATHEHIHLENNILFPRVRVQFGQ